MRLGKRNKRSAKSPIAQSTERGDNRNCPQPSIKETEDPDQQINMFDSDDVSITIFGIISWFTKDKS